MNVLTFDVETTHVEKPGVATHLCRTLAIAWCLSATSGWLVVWTTTATITRLNPRHRLLQKRFSLHSITLTYS